MNDALNSPSLDRRQFLVGMGGAALISGAIPSPSALEFKPWEPVSNKVVRMGIVGGNFGCSFQWHLHPNAKVTAVCDIRPDRIDRLQRTYNKEATGYEDFDDIIKDRNVDAIGVFTPAPLHVEMAVKAMNAGKHVISAVPAAMSLEECQQLLDCKKRTGMKYMMAETSYYRYQITAARKFAKEGAFGTVFYAESEYHHEALVNIWYEDEKGNYTVPLTGKPTWRQGLPPMLYPTHCTGMIIPVMRERLTEAACIGWGDDDPALKNNPYDNPFWNSNAFFKTSGGHSARVSIFWHFAGGGGERGSFYGDKMSFIMFRPEGSPDRLGYPQDDPRYSAEENRRGHGRYEGYRTPDFWELLPEPMRVPTGHGGSHTFITHEFIMAIIEDREPEIDVHESLAYTAPGIVAHQSALKDGEWLKVPSFDA